MCLLILGWRRQIIWNRIWLRPRMLSGEPNRSCWRSPKPHTLYGDAQLFVLSVMLVQYDKLDFMQINHLHSDSVNVTTLSPLTFPPAHSSLLHSSCSSGPPWSTRLTLWFCAPRLQGLWHEKVVHGDWEGEVSRHTWPGLFLKPVRASRCWCAVADAGWSTWRRANICRTSWRSWRQRSSLWSWRSSSSSSRPGSTVSVVTAGDMSRNPSTYLTAMYDPCPVIAIVLLIVYHHFWWNISSISTFNSLHLSLSYSETQHTCLKWPSLKKFESISARGGRRTAAASLNSPI